MNFDFFCKMFHRQMSCSSMWLGEWFSSMAMREAPPLSTPPLRHNAHLRRTPFYCSSVKTIGKRGSTNQQPSSSARANQRRGAIDERSGMDLEAWEGIGAILTSFESFIFYKFIDFDRFSNPFQGDHRAFLEIFMVIEE